MDRREANRLVAKFLEKGGVIQQLPTTREAPMPCQQLGRKGHMICSERGSSEGCYQIGHRHP